MNIYKYNEQRGFINLVTGFDKSYYYGEDELADSSDISSIKNWSNFYKNAGADYLVAKLSIRAILDNVTGDTGDTDQVKFDTLADDEERDICGLFNVVADAILVPFYITHLGGVNQAIAEGHYALRVFESIEQNANACKERFENKKAGWFPIMFTYYDQSVAETIISAIRDYVDDYIKYAKMGTQWGDGELGLIDFINGTGGIVVDLEDFQLKNGMELADVRNDLTKYFYI